MQFDTEAWPIALLVLRVVAVGLLYLFLLTAFRALRAELRAPAMPERRTALPPVAVGAPVAARAHGDATAAPVASVPALPDVSWDDEWDDAEWEDGTPDGWETEPVATTSVEPLPTPARRRPPARLWVPVAAAVLVAAFGGTALLLADTEPGAPPASESATGVTVDVSQPPTVTPAAGRVTVGLAATEDAQVRVTVDATVQFDGTLRKGERQSWEGGERIQVWTDSGKTLQLAVNGVDLGAYSPAMGHPDWNRIDFGFWPGWAQ